MFQDFHITIISLFDINHDFFTSYTNFDNLGKIEVILILYNDFSRLNRNQ